MQHDNTPVRCEYLLSAEIVRTQHDDKNEIKLTERDFNFDLIEKSDQKLRYMLYVFFITNHS